ncbi:Six-hairpin glycosidase [Penicillium argentinense]|uniref:alpha,alpha-trehalase n=1 Tax=Penicillium argentinense TaxID=1131581 RepID=A0A9W9G1X9_9EURO|nr:Six-hairpin glycosidase [Penicillium argentinense]KAJ5110621.1 Six-hairpin glycosidase [Penicillium argentinense]
MKFKRLLIAFQSLAWATVPLILNFGSLVVGASPKSRIATCLKRNTGSGSAGNFSRNVYQTDFDGVTWDEDNWLLTTTNLEQGQFQTRGSVANGYLGINVASVGPFFEMDSEDDGGGGGINGWPLYSRRQSFATISGFFDSQANTNSSNFGWLSQYGSDSVISGVPHWSGLILDLGEDTFLDASVDNSSISDFRTTYDFKAGVLLWSYKWTPSDKGSYQITYRLFVNKLYVNQAVVDMEVVASEDAEGSIVNVLDGASAVRSDFVKADQDDGAIFSAVRPNGISNVTAYIYANITGSPGVDLSSRKLVTDKLYVSDKDSSIAQSVDVKFKAGKAVRVTKFVGAASTDAFKNPQEVAKNASAAAMKNGYAKSLRSHVTEWASVMPEDSVDHYTFPGNGSLPADSIIIDSAVIAVANTYYLLQNTVGKNAIKAASNDKLNRDSISVGGLTSDSYGGQVFWDADVWMQPGLTTSHPEAAQRITNYRLDRYGQAQENIKTAYAGSQNQTIFSPSSAVYPWTSGRFGNCTATGPCWDYQYHLNGDIGISMVNEWVTSGDTQFFKENHFPIFDSVATLYSDLLVRNGSYWTLANMTDPDEYANHIDAGGFTMPLIAETLRDANAFRQQFGLEENSTWDQMANEVLVLRENGVTLEFTSMNGSAAVKQADVVLNTFPLDYSANYSAQDSLNDLDYYANKQSPDGPAMTWAIFSAVANEMSPSGCSGYTYALYSFLPYTRAPFYQLSEQLVDDATINGGTHPAFPFLTGHGGANQVAIFGYLGLRLTPEDYLRVDPNLPPQIPYLKYRTFYWRGWPISAWSNYTHTTISRAINTPPLDVADQRFANKSIEIHTGPDHDIQVHLLPLKGSVVLTNRQIGTQNTVAGNLVQCSPAQSENPYEPGQFPISVVDGASSTKWQPTWANNISAVTVSLGKEAGSMVSGFYFDWAQAPPVNATVVFHNKTLGSADLTMSSQDSDYQVVSTLNNIKLSDPYDVNSTNLDAIAIPTGNTTNVTLPSAVPAAQYATLLILGNQGLDPVDVEAKNGTGATVAEWAILGQTQSSSNSSSSETTQRMKVRAAAALADSGSFMQRRQQFFPRN